MTFIIWLAPRVDKMTQISRCDWLPERERWSHLSCSGLPAVFRKQNRPLSHGSHFESQEKKKLCFCLSSLALDERLAKQNLLFQHCVIKVYYPKSHIINPLLTKFARSRWLGIGFVLFCEFMDLDEDAK